MAISHPMKHALCFAALLLISVLVSTAVEFPQASACCSEGPAKEK